MKDATVNPASPQQPKLLDQLRRSLRDKHYSLRTEGVYVYWARWYIRFHGLRHPADTGTPEINAFLSYLANERDVSTSTHHQALCSLLFLYKHALGIKLPWVKTCNAQPSRPPTHGVETPEDWLDLCKNDRHAPSDCPAFVRHGNAVDGMRAASGQRH